MEAREELPNIISSSPPEGLHHLSLLPLTIGVKDEADGTLTASLADPWSRGSTGSARGGGTSATDARAGIRTRARRVLGTDVFT
jgi:hypothetical protein